MAVAVVQIGDMRMFVLQGLVPVGMQDVIFAAQAASSCSVKGVAASRIGGGAGWQTWAARMPEQAVSPADVNCGGRPFVAFEVVKR